jgi:bacteriorhodopsin
MTVPLSAGPASAEFSGGRPQVTLEGQSESISEETLTMADEAPTVTFPDDYPNSVRHFLLIGFLGMFIGSIVFFYMGISRKVNTVSHVLTFFIAAIASCSYYAMWAGLGVEYKTTDTTPRVIFWARYLDWVITLPVRVESYHS